MRGCALTIRFRPVHQGEKKERGSCFASRWCCCHLKTLQVRKEGVPAFCSFWSQIWTSEFPVPCVLLSLCQADTSQSECVGISELCCFLRAHTSPDGQKGLTWGLFY